MDFNSEELLLRMEEMGTVFPAIQELSSILTTSDEVLMFVL